MPGPFLSSLNLSMNGPECFCSSGASMTNGSGSFSIPLTCGRELNDLTPAAALLQAHAETAKVRDDQGDHELLVMELRQTAATAAANAERLPELEAQLAEQHEQSDRISQLEAELKAQEQQVSELRDSAASAHAAAERVVELEAQLEAQQRHSEKVAELERQLAAQDRNRESIVDLKAQLASQHRAEVVSDMRRRLSRMVQLLRELPGACGIPCAVQCDWHLISTVLSSAAACSSNAYPDAPDVQLARHDPHHAQQWCLVAAEDARKGAAAAQDALETAMRDLRAAQVTPRC